MIKSPVTASVDITKIDTGIKFDPRVFKKYESKETEVWSWRKMKHENGLYSMTV